MRIARWTAVLCLTAISVYLFQRENWVLSRRAVADEITILRDEVENLPAATWRAIPIAPPTTGNVQVHLDVVRGNALDVFLVRSDQVDLLKQENEWRNVQKLSAFDAVETRTYRRTALLAADTYYLVLRDRTLGLLSANSTDARIRVTLNP